MRRTLVVVLLLSVLGLVGAARQVNVLVSLPLTQYSSSLDMLTGFYTIPIAIEHFNNRDSRVVAALASLRCGVKLTLLNGTIYDDQSQSSLAMAKLIGTEVNDEKLDMILGSTSQVSNDTKESLINSNKNVLRR